MVYNQIDRGWSIGDEVRDGAQLQMCKCGFPGMGNAGRRSVDNGLKHVHLSVGRKRDVGR